MQPFDALTMRAILQEVGPLLLNRRFEAVYQLSRDEIVIILRNRSDQMFLLLSAHAVYGRVCVIENVKADSKFDKKLKRDRSQFMSLLNRDLLGSTLVGIEQASGERMVDLIFSCQNQVGLASFNTVTAEIMGKNSNIIFWRRSDKAIIASSHAVTKDMSRYREILPGLPYIRPPMQAKPSIYKLTKEQFEKDWQFGQTDSRTTNISSLQRWLMSQYSGIGKHLCSEMVAASLDDEAEAAVKEKLWQIISMIQSSLVFSPALKRDLSQYITLDFTQSPSKEEDDWLLFDSANQLVEHYYSTVHIQEVLRNLQTHLLKELERRLAAIEEQQTIHKRALESTSFAEQDKLFGDLIYANLNSAKAKLTMGESTLDCENHFIDQPPFASKIISIALDVNLSATENAQNFYQRYAKAKRRKEAAQQSLNQLESKVLDCKEKQLRVERSRTVEELQFLQQEISPKEFEMISNKKPSRGKNKGRANFLSATSSDGWKIFMGRNRLENDRLLSELAQPNDVWLHILGQTGSHVLIKASSVKQQPPLTTLIEAAQLAAHFSKAKSASKTKARVVYTHCRFVKKIPGGKPGVVTYENEKTIEVDIDSSPPKIMLQLG